MLGIVGISLMASTTVAFTHEGVLDDDPIRVRRMRHANRDLEMLVAARHPQPKTVNADGQPRSVPYPFSVLADWRDHWIVERALGSTPHSTFRGSVLVDPDL